MSTNPSSCILTVLTLRFNLPEPEYSFWTDSKGRYHCEIEIGDNSFMSTIPRHKSKDARNDAAELALDIFANKPGLFFNKKATKSPGYISALDKLCYEHGWGTPFFDFGWDLVDRGWFCDVSIHLGKSIFRSEGEETFRQKHDAKEDAAAAAYEWLTILIKFNESM